MNGFFQDTMVSCMEKLMHGFVWWSGCEFVIVVVASSSHPTGSKIKFLEVAGIQDSSQIKFLGFARNQEIQLKTTITRMMKDDVLLVWKTRDFNNFMYFNKSSS